MSWISEPADTGEHRLDFQISRSSATLRKALNQSQALLLDTQSLNSFIYIRTARRNWDFTRPSRISTRLYLLTWQKSRLTVLEIL